MNTAAVLKCGGSFVTEAPEQFPVMSERTESFEKKQSPTLESARI